MVAVERRLVFGTEAGLDAALGASAVSRTVNTSFVERQHGTDRGRNARKARKTYRFSKDWRVHEAMTYFTLYRYNFCWVVRTLRQRDEQGRWQRRTPAMAAGLADQSGPSVNGSASRPFKLHRTPPSFGVGRACICPPHQQALRRHDRSYPRFDSPCPHWTKNRQLPGFRARVLKCGNLELWTLLESEVGSGRVVGVLVSKSGESGPKCASSPQSSRRTESIAATSWYC